MKIATRKQRGHLPGNSRQQQRVVTCFLWLLLWLSGTHAWAGSMPILAADSGLAPLQGYIDFLHDSKEMKREALVQGAYDEQFRRYDSKLAPVTETGVWLRFRITNTSSSEQVIISLSETLYTHIELVHISPDGGLAHQQAGMIHPYIMKTSGYHDIAFAVTQPVNSTQTYYLRFVADYPLLLDGYVASPAAYAREQVKQTSIGHLLVGIMMGIMLYLAMISTYVRSLKEIYYCLAFVVTSFIVLLFGRGYIFFLLPHNAWLNQHLYALVYTALTLTYTVFSRQHFKTQYDFPMVDSSLRYIQYFVAGLLLAGLFIPIAWSIAIILVMAVGIIVFLCIISVYIWANSDRHLTAYVFGTLLFLFACILTAAENNGLLDLEGKTREIFEIALCFQAMLFALALAEKINGYQLEQTRLAIQAAEAQAENRAKNSFLAKMSHELRTPMNGLLGMLQLLENTPVNDQQKHYMQVMHNSGRLLLGVIDDVLDYSRIVAGKLRIEESDFDLAILLADIESLFTDTARQKQLALHVNLSANNHTLLHGDAGRLRQILSNLVSNGIKFTTAGSVTVRVRVEQGTDSDWLLHGEVEDTGCGINAEQMPTLFQEYAQSSMTRDYGGSGLGLAICKQLVEMMGGNIQVESAPGYGTLFRFFIRVAPAKNQATSSPATHAPAGKRFPSATATRILVVEDNEINREVIGGLLARIGLTAEFANNGSEAIKQVCQDDTHWSLILMDVEMPIMDGLAAAQHIRTWESAKYRDAVPIVALTAHAGRGYEETILKAGMDDHLSKPIDINQLQNTLRKWLGDAIGSGTQSNN